MNKPTTVALTWATLTAAVISACSLAGSDAALPDHRLSLLIGSAEAEPLASARSRLPDHPAAAAWVARRRPSPTASGPQRAMFHFRRATAVREKV